MQSVYKEGPLPMDGRHIRPNGRGLKMDKASWKCSFRIAANPESIRIRKVDICPSYLTWPC